MVTYAQNEASSTDISKQFGHYLSNVSNGIVEKRLETPREKYIDGNEVLKELNLSLND